MLWKWVLRAVVSELVGRLDQRRGERYLLMDATCWQFGKAKFHFPVLGLVFESVSIPFFFVNLAKKGCSSDRERIRLLQMANLLYPLRGMTLVADREYVGQQWFVDLVEDFGLNFVIRLSESDYKKEFAEQKAHYGQTLRKNGFNLEDMSLTNPAKVRLLMCVVVACYVLCVCEGIKQLRKIAVRKKTQTRYDSIFRRGYSVFCQFCQSFALFLDWMLSNFGKPIRYAPP